MSQHLDFPAIVNISRSIDSDVDKELQGQSENLYTSRPKNKIETWFRNNVKENLLLKGHVDQKKIPINFDGKKTAM